MRPHSLLAGPEKKTRLPRISLLVREKINLNKCHVQFEILRTAPRPADDTPHTRDFLCGGGVRAQKQQERACFCFRECFVFTFIDVFAVSVAPTGIVAHAHCLITDVTSARRDKKGKRKEERSHGAVAVLLLCALHLCLMARRCECATIACVFSLSQRGT